MRTIGYQQFSTCREGTPTARCSYEDLDFVNRNIAHRQVLVATVPISQTLGMFVGLRVAICERDVFRLSHGDVGRSTTYVEKIVGKAVAGV